MAFELARVAECTENAQVDEHGRHLGIVFADESGRVRQLNSTAETLTGWVSNEACGVLMRDLFRLIDPWTGDVDDDAMSQSSGGYREFSLAEAQLVTRDHEILNVEATCVRVPGGYALAFHDRGYAQRLVDRLNYQTSHDPITGLINRVEFLHRAEALVVESALDGTFHAMVYLDLDQFKIVNNTSGHDAGDELLRQVATLLLPQLRDTDLLGRLGGDEFGLLLRKCTLEDAERLSARLINRIRQHPFRWRDLLHTVSASAGVAAIGRETNDAQRALACAETACLLAKERGRGRVQTYRTRGL